MANEQEIARLVIRLVTEVKDVKTQLASVSQSTKSFADQSEKSAASFGSSIAALKMQYLAAAAAIYTAYRTIQKAADWAEIGAKAQQTEEAFATLTKSLNVNGDALISQMKVVGAAFVESTDLMTKAQRLLIEDLSPEQIVGMMDASRVAARLMGVDVSEAFDRVSEAVITLRTRGLKAAFPMDLAKITEDYARSLGTVSKYLSEAGQRQAIVNEIMRQGVEKKGLLGTMLDPTTAEQLEKISSAWGEMQEAVGKFIATMAQASAVLPALTEVLVGIGELAKALAKHKETLMSIANILTTVAKAAIPGVSAITAALNMLRKYGAQKVAEEKANAEKVEGYRDTGIKAEKQNQIDQRKRDEDLAKFRLANEEQRVAAQGEITRAEIERRRILEIDAARSTGEEVALVEMKWSRIALEQELALSKQGIAAKETQELEAARQGGMDQVNVRVKFNALRLAADAKYQAGLAKLESDANEYLRKANTEALASEEQRMTLRNQITRSAIETARDIEMEGARRRGEDVTAVELQYERKIAEDVRRARLAELTITEAKDIDSATREGKSRLDVEMNFILQRRQAEENYDNELAKIEEKSLSRTQQIWLEREKFMADVGSQLAEISGNYDLVTAAQVRLLEAERNEFVVSRQWAVLKESEQDVYMGMMDERISKLKETRALESMQGVAEWRRQLAEITGDWQRVNSAEWEALEALKQMLPLLENMTAKEKELAAAVYLRKQAEIEARNEMNFTAMNQQSVQKESLSLTNQLADSYGNLVVNSVDAAGNAVGNFLTNLADGTMSVGDAIRQLGSDFAKAIQKMVLDIIVLIIKMQILKALESSSIGAGLEGGGLVGAMQTGGSIRGPSGIDKVPIRATAGEYMQPVSAVRYYGVQAMEAIRRKVVPREFFAGLMVPSSSRHSFALAAGGSVPAAPSDQSDKGQQNLTFINVSDPRDIDKWAASSQGQGAILNVISSRADTVKKMLR
ncbi:MAG: hypothetical protein MUO24_02210 [Desulfobacterales bacterium]|nr:hypothetical protein [Desulfobacterales bacterium]